MENFKNGTARYLNDDERMISTSLKNIPLVIEPSENSGEINLPDFVAENSRKILSQLTENGAVLLRGFKVDSEKDFEQTITSIKGFQAMQSYFMAEPGRTLVEGLKYVHYTNKIYKTGGTFRLGGFHCENYYTCDVPQFINFWCSKPSAIGGETGLVHMGNVYKDLNSSIKEKLEAKAFLSKLYNIKGVSKKYNVTGDEIKKVCTDLGIPVNITPDGEEWVSLYKPSVIGHPVNSEPALAVNISGTVKGLDTYLKKILISDYSGFNWTLHRLFWRYPGLLNPKRAVKKAISSVLKGKKGQDTSKQSPEAGYNFPAEKLGSVFSEKDISLLAQSVRNNLISFTWERGDILLVDNLQVAHAGLPGFGSRTIRAILCNPIRITPAANASGRLNLGPEINYESLAATMEGLNTRQGSLV